MVTGLQIKADGNIRDDIISKSGIHHVNSNISNSNNNNNNDKNNINNGNNYYNQ